MVNVHVYLIVLVTVFALIEFSKKAKHTNPDAGLNIEQLVQKYGYPIEAHNVTTDDGYILALHRIPNGKKETQQKRIPVLLMHGFIQSAANFVNRGPNNALSLLLADKGYDVWLGNARGSTWSRKHVALDPNKDPEFWNFSLHEIGLYDISAFVDYILEVTQQDSLHYIGYSQGTSTFFMLLSERPEYVAKIRLMTALAPAIFLKDPEGPIANLLIYYRRFIEFFFEFFNIQEVFARNGFISTYLKQVCDENSMFVNLCLHHMFLIQGYSHEESNKTMLSLVFSNTPAGASPKQMLHLLQLMESGNFHQYDLGVKGNVEKYGQRYPPSYNLSKVTTPTALYYSSNDWTININNMERVVKTLPNVVKSYNVPSTFNHDDFVHGKNVVDLLYNSVIEEIMKY